MDKAKRQYFKPKVGCALWNFFFSLIYRNAEEIPQDPRAKFWGKIWDNEDIQINLI
ncbi:hypothetical protein SAMN04488514_1023 [Kriegella aquimaris]|uniref:Uncharacterized protein n=1 Tax=Kriegella aquimaris TaxID=192904 RepID=A0A1G9LBY1_9FLAO|nr:hypothetical protein SAMN04488514_1023 [Kriegella aquimaris]